ncbi:MAG: rhodanese-like domain-containing protein [Psychromonas sp.]
MLLDGKALVASLRAEVNEVDCAAVHQHFRNNTPLLFIDIREESETAIGSPFGCERIPRGVLEMQLTTLPAYQALLEGGASPAQLPIYLLCRSGARSVLAAASLQKMGYENVYSVAGGYIAWQQQGLLTQGE